MQSEVLTLTFFLSDKHQFRAPLYQRRYRWNAQKARVFWDDLLDLNESRPGRTHFFGPMVMEQPTHESSIYTYNVVDGQQRLITLNLFVRAVMSQFTTLALQEPRANTLVDDFQNKNPSQECLDVKLLYSKGFLENINPPKPELTWKFKPTVWDEQNFASIMKDGKPSDARANLWKVYEFFKDELSKHVAALSSLEEKIIFISKSLRSLSSFQISRCLLDPKSDDPNQVFESINSKGEKLSSVDLIRNFALLGFSDDVRKIHYKDLWEPMEACLCPSDDSVPSSLFPDFVRAIIVMRKGELVSKSEVFEEFKAQYERMPSPGDTGKGMSADALKEMFTYAKICKELVIPAVKPKAFFERKVFSLNQIGMTTHLPLLLKFKGLEPSQSPSPDQLADAMSIIERYFVRRAVLNKGVHSIGELFALLARLYSRESVPNEQFSSWLLKHLSSDKISYKNGKETLEFEVPACPKNDEIKRILPVSKAYEVNQSICRYMLATLEVRSGEYVDSKPNKKEYDEEIFDYDLDHVLPQSWGEHWKADIKVWYPSLSDLEIVGEVDECVHQIGNLVLSDYNRKMKHFRFSEKKSVGYTEKKCGVAMTREVGRNEKWTFEMIRQRSVSLTDEILKTWPEL